MNDSQEPEPLPVRPTRSPIEHDFALEPIEEFPARCTAHALRTGLQCQRAPLRGAVVCWAHGASAPQVQAAAARRLERAELVRLLDREAVVVPVTDPISALQYLAGESEAYRSLLLQRVGQLTHLSSKDRFAVERAAALLALYEGAADRSGRFLASLAKLSLADRVVRVDEAKALLLIEMVRAAMASINMAPTLQASLWTALRIQIDHSQSSDPTSLKPPSRRDRKQIDGAS